MFDYLCDLIFAARQRCSNCGTDFPISDSRCPNCGRQY